MTYGELKQKLALDKLVETGVGLVSEKTYNDITQLFAKSPPMKIYEIEVCGIKLIKNPFIPDGEIWPFEKWGLSPKERSHSS